MIRVAINGFGRIGRLTFRQLFRHPDVEVVAINDLTDVRTLVHLLKYDSVHGRFGEEVTYQENTMTVAGREVRFFRERDPGQLPWNTLQVDVVLECTGIFRSREKASLHLAAGARKVLISAPAGSSDIPTVVMGVNDGEIDWNAAIISNASCTTNCAAPLLKIVHEAFRVERGMLMTVHAYTADQRLQDAPHIDLRRARAAAQSIIPTSTGAARAVGSVIPDLAGKLDGLACRVPVPSGSFVDLTLVLGTEATAAKLNALVRSKATGALSGILEYSEDELVSIDIVGSPYSCIFDSKLTTSNGRLVKLFGWYDNEMGYSARLAEVAVRMGKTVTVGSY